MSGHVLHLFPTFGGGGSQSRTCRLIDAVGEPWAHTVIALDGDLRSGERLDRRPGVRVLPAPPGARARLPHLDLVRLLREHEPDIVATYNWGAIDGLMAARLLKLPVIHHEDGFNPDEMERQKSRRIWTRRLLLRGVHRVVVPSRTLERIAAGSWQVPDPKLAYIPNGIDTDRFRPGSCEEIRRRLRLDPRALLVGTVGHLNRGKNIAMLMRAVGTANNQMPVDLVILGEGPERARLEALAETLHIAERVHFAGQVEDPAPWYRAIDLFAMSSRTEQMPVSVLEAMATGLPVLATDVGDTREMVAAENREMIVPLGDSGAYVAALIRALQRGPLRHALGTANRERVRTDYDQWQMIERHAAIWTTALPDRSGRDELAA